MDRETPKWEDAILRLRHGEGWKPFIHDTIEAQEAFVAGRKFRREFGPKPNVEWNQDTPYAKMVAGPTVTCNQDYRVEWELGWKHEHERLAVVAMVPEDERPSYFPTSQETVQDRLLSHAFRIQEAARFLRNDPVACENMDALERYVDSDEALRLETIAERMERIASESILAEIKLQS